MYPEHNLGINLEKVIVDARYYLNQLHHLEQEPFDFYCFDIEILDAELDAMVEELRIHPPEKHE